MQAWIVVGSQDNFELLRERNFDIAAFKASRRKQAAEMQPGDRLVFYLTKVVEFGGVVEVASEACEDDSDLGLRSDSKAEERFPQRVRTRPLLIPEPGDYVDVREITDLLDKTRKHGPKKLGMAFRGNLHKISEGDYQQIERLLRERIPVS